MSIEAPEAVETGEQASVGVSVLEHLNARREEIITEADDALTLPVPRWKGALGIRFEYPENGADIVIRAAVKAQQTNDAAQILDANLSLLTACCAAVVGRKPGETWQPLDESDPRPVRFSQRLADLLRIKVPNMDSNPAKWICRQVFSPRYEVDNIYKGDVAILTMGGHVLTFLQTGEARADEDLAGE